MFKSNQIDESNKDDKGLRYYLNLTKGYVSDFPVMEIVKYEDYYIVDESPIECGFKARAADFAVQNTVEDEIVYVQPRRGYAGISLAYLCKKHGKKLTLFMPSSKEISDHQALCIQYGADPRFVRIAAMPNANKYAKEYAERVGAKFFPLGLQDEMVTAGAVREIHDSLKGIAIPEMWSVISTGVLSRALQIALPKVPIINVAVSRNIQQGELGRAQFMSYHKPFNSKADWLQTAVDIEDSYDAKGFEYMRRDAKPGTFFFNVAGNAPQPTFDKTTIDSYRDWGDKQDL